MTSSYVTIKHTLIYTTAPPAGHYWMAKNKPIRVSVSRRQLFNEDDAYSATYRLLVISYYCSCSDRCLISSDMTSNSEPACCVENIDVEDKSANGFRVSPKSLYEILSFRPSLVKSLGGAIPFK